MRQYGLVCNVEAQAQMSRRRLYRVTPSAEGLENHRQDIDGNGSALVCDLDQDVTAAFRRGDQDIGSWSGVINSVPHNVGQHLGQPICVPGAGQLPPNVTVHLGVPTHLQLFDDVATDFVKIGWFQIKLETAAETCAGELEQLRNHSPHSMGASADAFNQLYINCANSNVPFKDLRRHANRIKGITQIVADNGQKLLAKLRRRVQIELSFGKVFSNCLRDFLGNFGAFERFLS